MDERTPKKRTQESDQLEELDGDYNNTPTKCSKTKNTKQVKRRQKYRSLWEKEYGSWLTDDPQNEFNGKCKLCGVTFTIASAGIGQVSEKKT